MDEKTIRTVEAILQRGERVELIPVKGGVKIVRIKREEVGKRASLSHENMIK